MVSSEFPLLTEALVQRHADPESFLRGKRYFQRGAVQRLIWRTPLLEAIVAGSQSDPYIVQVIIRERNQISATCTCPYDWGGWCKHIVAVLLAYIHRTPTSLEVRPSLVEQLGDMCREDLIGLIQHLVVQEPGLLRLIDAFLGNTNALIPNAELLNEARSMRQRFAQLAERLHEYRPTELSVQLNAIMQPIFSLIQRNQINDALSMLREITHEFMEQWTLYPEFDETWESVDDYLGRMWVHLLLSDRLTPSDRKQWERQIAQWIERGDEYGFDGMEIALLAAREGWDAPHLVQAMRGESISLQGMLPTQKELIALRIDWLREHQDLRSALNLARAAQLYGVQAQILVDLGRANEAFQVVKLHARSPREVQLLVEALVARNEIKTALDIGIFGLKLRGERAELAEQVAELARTLERPDLQRKALEALFSEAPSLLRYQELMAISGEAWPKLRSKLLKQLLRDQFSYVFLSERIDIMLYENLQDEAIKLVDYGWSLDGLIRVMDAVATTRPDWVIATALKRANWIINAGRANEYDQAVDWLRRARDACLISGRAEQWERTIRDLNEQHRRKYKLMTLLNGLAK